MTSRFSAFLPLPFRLAFISASVVFAGTVVAQSQNQQPFPFNQLGGSSGQGSSSSSGMATGGALPGMGSSAVRAPSIQSSLLGGSGGASANTDPSNRANGEGELFAPLLPKPISAFQRYVFETTGKLLPYYGEQTFDARRAVQPANLPVAADYEISAGDEIFLRVWGGIDVNVLAKVDRDGQLSIPSVGTFPVSGVKARDLDGYLSSQIAKYYKNFNLSASLGKLAGLNIYVAGQAHTPGMHAVPSTSTLASVIFSVAQPGANGSYRTVQLKRGGQVVASFDLYELLKNGELKGDRKLLAGDVVFIAPSGPRVALNIDTPNATIVELKPGESLDDVLTIAGVDRTLLRQDAVLIEGFEPARSGTPRAVEQIAYSRAMKEAKLRDGDIVTLFQVRMDFSNAVTLKGNVAAPARYPHYKGMKVSDLIPNTDVLIQPDYFKKKSALVGFDKTKADKSLRDPRLFDELTYEQQLEQQRRLEDMYLSNPPLLSNPALLNQARAGQGNTGAANQAGGALPGQSQQNQAGFGAVNGFGNVAGGVPLLREAQLDKVEETIKSLMPQINWDYAVIERLDRAELKPVLVPFNLRKAMGKDPSQDLELQPGDVVTIFSVQDADIPKSKKTGLIKVTGEVASPGFYQIAPGETLRDVLVKAGGLGPDAFLFGTKLTRKSIMKQQEEQFKKALDQAERLLMSATNASASSALNPVDAANAQMQAARQQQYLDKLRNTKPDGRVVLDVRPGARSIAELPPLELVDGDIVAVPTLPGQVTIFGSVYTQGAFAYQNGQTVYDYLDMAGGAAKSSDKGSIFVLRANGTVDSAQQGWVPFVSGLFGKRALPGDTIYVPEDFERVSFMKGLLDISQIFYQVGLGAAAIKAIQD